MKRLSLLIVLVACSLFIPFFAQARESTEKQFIRLQTATFDPLVDTHVSTSLTATDQTNTSDNPYYILQFDGAAESISIEQIEKLGAEIVGYIPDNALLIHVEPNDLAKVQSVPTVRWIGPYQADYKVSPSISSPTNRLAETNSMMTATIVAFPDESLDVIHQSLEQAGISISQATETDLGPVFRVEARPSILKNVAANPAIQWIEPYFEPELANTEGRRIMNVESVWESNGYFGEGQIVAVSDSGLSVEGNLNPDFEGRLKKAFPPSEMNLTSAECRDKTTWTDLNGHGTHVAGSVLGNGRNSDSDPASKQYANSFAGTAPEAELVFMSLNTDGSGGIQCVDDNADFIAKGYQEGARISTNSWGGPTGGSPQAPEYGGYTFSSNIVDNYIWNNKDYLVLFAAGNAGPGPDTIGAPGTAKNVLTVGASENNRPDVGREFDGTNIADDPDTLASFSSRGPTDDGRVKPDVVAPGTFILSVRAAQAPDSSFWLGFNEHYAYTGGTSMATPLTAGSAALVREWSGKERGLANPSAAMMKALIIHGAAQLPGTPSPDTESGWGRVDLKNTLNAQYAIFEDNVQGLTTGNSIVRTIEVVGSTTNGTLIAGNPDTYEADPKDVTTQELTATEPPPATPNTVTEAPDSFDLQAVPGFDEPYESADIPDSDTSNKAGLTPVEGTLPIPPSNMPATTVPQTEQGDGPVTQSFLQNMVGGGDFEDPGWSSIWSNVWQGIGQPVRTDGSDNGIVLNGSHSIWLGGTPTDDSIWYPVSFPDTIDSDFASGLEFSFQMRNLDRGSDSFCVAIIDASGSILGNIGDCYSSESDGIGANETFTYTNTFDEAERNALRGQTGYLVLFNIGDGQSPHLSTFVDDVTLAIDFADVTLEATPSAGPAGTTFLLTGSNNVPYGEVEFCQQSCNDPNNSLGFVFADARGDVVAYLPTSETIEAGVYSIVSQNVANRTATTDVRITGDETPASVSVTPPSGAAGTEFAFTGTGFVPNDNNIEVVVNDAVLGTVGSNVEGGIAFTIQTSSNTPANTYNVRVTDSANRSATTSYQVTGVASGNPTMSVTPESGPPGTGFTFTGQNFTASQGVSFTLDGQSIGEATTDASGGFEVTLNTTTDIPPGSYTLEAVQGSVRASAQFAITDGGGGGGGGQPSGNGLYVTLAWTDPPAQVGAQSTLVNNLDLRLEGPDGQIYHGNGGNAPDTRNNVENIRLENPAPGTYQVTVEASRVSPTYGSQPFALVATTSQNFGSNETEVGFGNRIYLPLIAR
ncbi:MAG: S8 family serine peptidase [Chloroflexota bacterium]